MAGETSAGDQDPKSGMMGSPNTGGYQVTYVPDNVKPGVSGGKTEVEHSLSRIIFLLERIHDELVSARLSK